MRSRRARAGRRPPGLAAAAPTVYETVSGTFAARGSTWTAAPQQAQHPCPTTTRPERPTPARPARRRGSRRKRANRACCGVTTTGWRVTGRDRSVTRPYGLCHVCAGSAAALCQTRPRRADSPSTGVRCGDGHPPTPACNAASRFVLRIRDGSTRHGPSAGDGRAAGLVEHRARSARGSPAAPSSAPARYTAASTAPIAPSTAA